MKKLHEVPRQVPTHRKNKRTLPWSIRLRPSRTPAGSVPGHERIEPEFIVYMIRGFGEGMRRQRSLRRQALTRTSGHRALPRGTESSHAPAARIAPQDESGDRRYAIEVGL